MIIDKMHLGLNWKASLALILSLFVFTAYNNDVKASAQDAVQTELVLSPDFFHFDSTVSFSKSIQSGISSPDVVAFFSTRLYTNRYDEYANLLVKTRLTSFISFKNHISSFWEIYHKCTVFPAEDEVFTL